MVGLVAEKVGNQFEEFLDQIEAENRKNRKDDEKSVSARNLGNDLYKAKKFEEAVAKYTDAIKLAENDSETLALGFANRSAVLFQMKEYKRCLQVRQMIPFLP